MRTVPARLTPRAPLTTYHLMELDRVLKIANSRLAVLPGVESFEIAPMKGDAHHREYHTQIRANSLIASQPVEFRYCLPLHHSGWGDFNDLAWDLVGRAHQFLADGELAKLGARARSAIEPIIAGAAGVSTSPRLVAVGISFEFAERTPRICADIEMLGNDLVLAVERVVGLDVEHLEREVARSVRDHERRDAVRSRAISAHASGWIDQTALRLIDAAGLGRRQTIEMIAREGWVNFTFCGNDGDDFDASLHLADGLIVGWTMPRDRGWSLKLGDLIVWGKGMPETLRSSLIGRGVGEIFQNPELPANAVIVLVEETTSVDPESDSDDQTDGWLRLMLEIPIAEIDEGTGEPRGVWLADVADRP